MMKHLHNQHNNANANLDCFDYFIFFYINKNHSELFRFLQKKKATNCSLFIIRIEINCYGLIPKTFSPCSVISRPLVSTSSETLKPIVALRIPKTIAVITAAQAT